MTREEALTKLADLKKADDDAYYAHMAGDEVLCELLTQLGYADVVEAWKKIEKWYS